MDVSRPVVLVLPLPVGHMANSIKNKHVPPKGHGLVFTLLSSIPTFIVIIVDEGAIGS